MLLSEGVSEQVIGAAIRVHRALGPVLLEKPYKMCLAHELRRRGLSVAQEQVLDLHYDELVVPGVYRLDLIVDDAIVVEVKSVETLKPVHEAQLLTYLQLTGLRVGLLLNFNVPRLKDGLVRRVR